jgi:putative ABC transport system permease protein
LKRINFYFTYAWRSVLRGGQRTIFAVLCIAVGVATLVALQSLGQSSSDTLLGDAKFRAGGDLVLSPYRRASTNFVAAFNEEIVTPELTRLKNEGIIEEWTPFYLNSVQIRNSAISNPLFNITNIYSVKTAQYPFYGNVQIVEPQGANFKDLLKEPGAVVVSKTLWEQQKLKLGDTLVLNVPGGTSEVKLKVVGQTGIDVPGIPGIGQDAFFGFGYVSYETGLNAFSNTVVTLQNIFVKTRTEALADTAATQLAAYSNRGNPQLFNVRTAIQLQEQIKRGLNDFNTFLTYVGLLSVLIGGIGVINTMLVVIGRRTLEIATVKTLGLKKWQTVWVFTTEAFILGILGSLAGLILGTLLSIIVKNVAEVAFGRPLLWSPFYIKPLILGLLVGTVTSMIFGFLPAFAASRVRPGAVLRMQPGALPSLGFWGMLLIILFIGSAMSLLAGAIIGNVVIGFAVAFGTLVVSALLVGIMWVIVLLVGWLPAPFGPSFKMALRSFSRHRGRTATTLLVLTLGIFSVSAIVILAESVKGAINKTLNADLGYNVTIVAPFEPSAVAVNNALGSLPGLQKTFYGNSLSATIESVNGQSWAQYSSNLTNAGQRITLSGRGFVNGEARGASGAQDILSGRNFTATDENAKIMLINNDVATRYGLKVGDKVQFKARVGLRETSGELQIVGEVGAGNQNVNLESGFIAPANVVKDLGATQTIFFLLIDPKTVDQAMEILRQKAPGTLALDLSDLIEFFTKLLDQILAFPALLSLLSLFSGAILIANNVALSMLERRTEIGVMKAIGAKQRRIMNMMLLESGLVGLLGGIIGVGLAIVLVTFAERTAEIPSSWQAWSPFALIGLSIFLAVFATITSAWSAVKEKPLVVLRYE